jgi:hypothetical protein
MAALAMPTVEYNRNPALTAKLFDFTFEFGAVHWCISHISVRVSNEDLEAGPRYEG